MLRRLNFSKLYTKFLKNSRLYNTENKPISNEENKIITNQSNFPQNLQNKNINAQKMIFSSPNNITLNEDDEEELEITHEVQQLSNNLAFKALLYATLINIAAAIIFVLVMRYVYNFKTIKEFKEALNLKIQIFKNNVKGPIQNFKQESTETVVNFKKNTFGETESPKDEKTVEKMNKLFGKESKE